MTKQEFLNAVVEGSTYFAGLNFKKEDFRGLTFKNIIFKGCSFVDCSFTGADLRQTNFTQCYLAYSDFENADLTNAIFDRANLYLATLHYANCLGASFTDALISRSHVKFAKKGNFTNVINNKTTQPRAPYKFESDNE